MANEKTKSNKHLKALAKAVRHFREQANISQEELAERAGIDRTYVSGLERGIRNPSLLVLVKVAKGLGITLAKLIQAIES